MKNEPIDYESISHAVASAIQKSILVPLVLSPLFGFAFVWLLGFAADKVKLRSCVESKVIRMVGGCNVFGTCGVTFSDYSHGTAYVPSPGQEICTRREYMAATDKQITLPELNYEK